MPPLHNACNEGDISAIRALAAEGVDLDIPALARNFKQCVLARCTPDPPSGQRVERIVATCRPGQAERRESGKGNGVHRNGGLFYELGQIPVDEAGVDIARGKTFMAAQGRQKAGVGDAAGNFRCLKACQQLAEESVPEAPD